MRDLRLRSVYIFDPDEWSVAGEATVEADMSYCLSIEEFRQCEKVRDLVGCGFRKEYQKCEPLPFPS